MIRMKHFIVFTSTLATGVLISIQSSSFAFVSSPNSKPKLPPPHRYNADFITNEADVIQAIKGCFTWNDVDCILRDAAPLQRQSPDSVTPRAYEQENNKESAVEATIGPNVAALALRKAVDLNGAAAASTSALPLLLENVGTAVILSLRNSSSASMTANDNVATPQVLTPYALADVLVSLATLSLRSRNNDSRTLMQPLAGKVCDLIETQQERFIRNLGPKRLVECLEALTWLRMIQNRTCLVQAACDRLKKGDALSSLSARELTRILQVCHVNVASVPPDTTKTFLRRLRKQSVRQRAAVSDLSRALVVAGRFEKCSQLASEAKIMCYTLAKELTQRLQQQQPSKLLGAKQAGRVLTSCYKLGMEQSDPAFVELCDVLCQQVLNDTICTAWDVADLISALQRLQLVERIEMVKLLGERFLQLVEDDGTNIDPPAVDTILRSVVLMYHSNHNITQPFLDAAKRLFLNKNGAAGGTANEESNNTFLSHCNELELSNFVWFMSMAHWYDEDVLVALADRIMEPDIADSCSPKLACRILGSFTTLVSWQNTKDAQSLQMQNLLPELFYIIGPCLLSSRLTPTDASSAIFAYAKASYIKDMGIFDHLAELLASMVEECTVRQLAQSLWACGKMMVWENGQQEEGVDGFMGGSVTAAPPYLPSARQYAAVLSSRTKELTAKDVAQSIWACGRLGITDFKIVYSLAYRARQVASTCTTQEVANILWGLGKVGYDERDTVAALTSRMIDPSMSPNPQEASNVLYALGRMEICNKTVFSKLTHVMMGQLQDASPQAIANALFAHRAVHLTPPQELMDGWAIQKLGLNLAHPTEDNA